MEMAEVWNSCQGGDDPHHGDEHVLFTQDSSKDQTTNVRVSADQNMNVNTYSSDDNMKREDFHESSEDGSRNKNSKVKLQFHQILTDYVGEFGQYQIFYTLHKTWSTCLACMYSLVTVFLAAEPEHFCDVESFSPKNLHCRLASTVEMFIPKVKRHGEMQPSQCTYYNMSQFMNNLSSTNESFFYCPQLNVNATVGLQQIKCNQWIYNETIFQSTIITEWNLVCSKAGLAANANSVYWFGVMAGYLVAGHLSDRFGRKLVGNIGYVFFLLFGIITSFSPNYTIFLVLRFLGAMFKTWKEVGGGLASLEIVGESRRIIYFIFEHTGWCFGYFFMDIIAYNERRWRYLHAYIVLSDVIAFLLFAFYFRESPRWLVTQGRQAEALKEMKIVAARNGKKIPSKICLAMQKETLKVSAIELFRFPNLRKVTLMLFYVWFSMGLTYYGISMHTGHLGGNPFFTFFVSGMSDLISGYVALWLYHKFGRIRPYGFGCIAGGIVLILSIFVPTDVTWIIFTTAMVGKFLVNIPGTGNWMLTQELYPTSIRSIGVHTCSVMARIGAVGASYIGILAHVNRALPLLLFGSCSVVSGFISLMLPETKGEPLKQTVVEGEMFMERKFCSAFPCRSKHRRADNLKDDGIEKEALLTSEEDDV